MEESYIKKSRIQKGFSHQRLANAVGVSRLTIIRAEKFGCPRRSPLAISLSIILEIPLEKIIKNERTI